MAAAASSDDAEPCCWICLGGVEAGALMQPCACPRSVHQQCLARWQLQQAGREEEKICRFCCQQLPPWEAAHAALPKAAPLMTVVFNGVSHLLAVEPTPAGQARFEADVRRIFNLGPHEQLQLTWSCRLPGTGEELQLEGSEAFGAAAHLASLSAGQRLQREQAAGAAAAAPAGAASTASPGPGSPTPGSRLRRSRWFG